MPLLVGIDEVGYGPKLGPLIVSAAAFRVNDPEIDLWSALRNAVTPEPGDPLRLPVCDSKKIFSQQKGLASLHPTVSAFLSLLPSMGPLSYPALAQALSIDPADLSLPWYAAEGPAIETYRQGERLAAAMRHARVDVHRFAMQILEPSRFNTMVQNHGNKSHVLFRSFATLVESLLSSTTDPVVRIFVGKHGGRQFYLPDLTGMAPDAWVTALSETPERSSYSITRKFREVRIDFLMDGEDRHFCIALASMIGKYVRELAMGMFNTYWRSHVPNLRPTAGYHPDADRFLKQISSAMTRQDLDQNHLVRIR